MISIVARLATFVISYSAPSFSNVHLVVQSAAHGPTFGGSRMVGSGNNVDR